MCHGCKGISDGHVDVFVSVIAFAAAIDDDLAARHRYIDDDVINVAFVVMSMWSFDYHAAAQNVVVETIELSGALLNAGFDGRRSVHTFERHLWR